MYNKIASIILNSGKNNNYAGEVFVSQPDSNKERLAGKIFVLAEIEGKKSETQKIINFLVNIFDYNYYGDEKILLRDKIEGIRIEDIFETVLARVNQGLLDFLTDEHLRINPESTNLTLGVIHEDKLYFSNYGKNKAFLIYRRKGDYEILNIESNTTDGEDIVLDETDEISGSMKGKIFSSVINGEIPSHSYFLFTNEALPEYLSNREMVNIITKLPPMVAAEQIKNFLQKINSFAPFLGIIVKSTVGLGLNDFSETHEDEQYSQVAGASVATRGNRNAHSSISHLNYTEQKTESMLAPAGIINVKKLIKGAGELLSKLKVDIPENKKVVKFYDDETTITTASPKESRRKEFNGKEAFVIKEKLVFKKKSYFSFNKIGNFFIALAIIFTPHFWNGVFYGLRSWIKSLGKKDRVLVGALASCFLILIVSIVYGAVTNKTRLAAEQFNQIVTNIDNKQADVFRYTAVGNDVDAAGVLNELIISLQNSIPQNKEQQAKKDSLLTSLFEQSDKIQKITKIDSLQEIVNVNNWNAQAVADNLVLNDSKIYLSDGANNSIYTFNLKDSVRNQIALISGFKLSSPAISDSSIYYLAGEKVVKVSGQTASVLNLGGEKLAGESFIQFYNDALYLLNKNSNQIYKYNKDLSSRSNWLKEPADFSKASDFKVNGQIIISQSDADLLKYNKGKKIADYKTAIISPSIRADKVIITSGNYYLLDFKNNRLINLTKDGALVKQYRIVKDNIKDFAIDESGKAAYILSGTTVYKFGL